MVLDPKRRSGAAEELERALQSKIVQQPEAIQAIVSVFQVFLAGMNLSGQPVGSLLFLGPTGSGKTRIVEATAETLFGDVRALIKIDCGEFQHSHEIAKLIGSPPGYLGHRETHPVLTQEALNHWHREDLKLSLVLFDEIEKASDALWNLLLGVLDRATLTLGDNRRVDFSQTLILMTSNLGAAEIAQAQFGGLGFSLPPVHPLESDEQKPKKLALEAARRKFSPEFLNRIDKVVVFRSLTPEDLEQVLEIELRRVQERLHQASGAPQFSFCCTPEAKRFLLHNGLDLRYGARHLRRSIERHLVDPLAHLMATHQVASGDTISVDRPEGSPDLTFIKSGRSNPLPHWISRVGQAGLRSAGPVRSHREHVPSSEIAASPSRKPSP
ncbi:MAG: ATP-dependent Clp protease ATP-binding subunit [Acidobacteria bacterium]|nr:ATP-dependent Clp protease ATP-binding subunit [Acidobacteriota bacterium]